MGNRLTEQDYKILRDFANKGDVFSYWDYLSAKEDGYAGLARGVVTNETLQGCIANAHTAQSAAKAGIKLSPDDGWRLKESIMRGDLATREGRYRAGAEDGGLKLSAREIQGYHKTALEGVGLNANGWTANSVIEPMLNRGQDAGADRMLKKMQNGNVSDYMAIGAQNLTGDPGWTWNSAVNTIACFSPKVRGSLRTVDRIGNWRFDGEKQQWLWDGDSPIDYPPEQAAVAPPDIAQQLNDESAWRARRFGSNAITQDGRPYSANRSLPGDNAGFSAGFSSGFAGLPSDRFEEQRQNDSFNYRGSVQEDPYTPIDEDEVPKPWQDAEPQKTETDDERWVRVRNSILPNQLEQIEKALSVMSRRRLGTERGIGTTSTGTR